MRRKLTPKAAAEAEAEAFVVKAEAGNAEADPQAGKGRKTDL